MHSVFTVGIRLKDRFKFAILVSVFEKENIDMKYKTQGTCSQEIEITLDSEGLIENVTFVGGCNGNLKGVGALVKGMKPEDVIARCKGIRCGFKSTSCPDQLARALESML